jgi:hypothetical protein
VDRRTFVGTLAGGLLAAPLAVEAQQLPKVPRIGVLEANPLGQLADSSTGTIAFSYAHPIFWAPFSLGGDGGKS